MRKLLFKRKALNLTLAAMLFMFSVTGVVFSQAITQTTNEFIPLAQLAFVPCANGGAGELVLITGILHIQTHITISNNTVNIKQHFQPQGATAIGLSTGDVYRAVGVTQFHDTFPLVDGAATSSFVNNFRMIGPGRNNNLQIHQNIHTTVNANGEVTSVIVNESIVCN